MSDLRRKAQALRGQLEPAARGAIKWLAPPAALAMARWLLGRVEPAYGAVGDYSTFAAALEEAGPAGYESGELIAKVREATAAFVREVRQERELGSRTRQLLSAMYLPTACRHDHSQLTVLDFGGALGRHYHDLRRFLPRRIRLAWNVVETPAMAGEGRRRFATSELHFVDSLATVAQRRFDVVLAIGSLQYVEDPAACFRQLAALRTTFLLLDRFPLVDLPRDRLTVQRVPPTIYRASYPAWFFSEQRWRGLFQDAGLMLRSQWHSPEDQARLGDLAVSFLGFLLERGSQTAPAAG
jgi:putative methyltransferase (TIGR04325 family)